MEGDRRSFPGIRREGTQALGAAIPEAELIRAVPKNGR